MEKKKVSSTKKTTEKKPVAAKESIQDKRVRIKLHLESVLLPLLEAHPRLGIKQTLGMADGDIINYVKELADELYDALYKHGE